MHSLAFLSYQQKFAKKTIFLTLALWLLVCLLVFFNEEGRTMVDYFFSAVLVDAGMITNYREFFFPYFWFLVHAVPSLGMLLAFQKDHAVMGMHQVLKCATKRSYFYGKFISVFLVHVFLFFTELVLFLLLAAGKGGETTQDMLLLLRFLLFFLLENSLLSLLGILLLLFFSSRIAILLLLLDLSLAMFTNVPFFLGQASLPYKQQVFGGAFSLQGNIATILCYFAVWGMASFLSLGRYDFLGDKK